MRQVAHLDRNRVRAARTTPPRQTVVARPRRRRFRGHPPRLAHKHFLALLIVVLLGAAAIWEMQTSDLQSWAFSHWSSTLRYTVLAGPSPQLA
ncbi:MAG: hypothetical protein ACREU6_13285, partial [Steroidobacteraceae bacterium]